MPTVAQRSFASGEIAPALYARVDMVKYATGLRTCKNMLIRRSGGAENRPGTQFIGEVPFSFTKGRILPFIFNSSQTYVLEFSDKKLRIIKNGASIYDKTITITGITNSGGSNIAAQATSVGHGLTSGDLIDLNGVVGMPEVNGRRYCVVVIDADTFGLYDVNNLHPVSSVTFGTYTSGGTANRVYTIATPYAEADLATIHFIQSADVITITHNNYLQRKLTRTADSAWTLSPYTFTPGIAAPGSLVLTSQDGTHDIPGTPWGYVVTAVDKTTFEESVASSVVETGDDLTVSSDRYNLITWGAVANAGYYNVYKHTSYLGALGFIASVNGTSYTDTSPGGHPDFTNTPPVLRDPFNFIATISGITKASPGVVTATAHGFAAGEVIDISGVAGMTEVNGLVAVVTSPATDSFSLYDTSGAPIDTSGFTTYTSAGQAAGRSKYPATASYYQERLCFANLKSDPEGTYTSKSGVYQDFKVSVPTRDDDAITFKATGRQVNEIRHLVDLGVLIQLTSGGEHICKGDISGVLKPSAINRRQYSYIGSAKLQPVIVGQTAIFLQEQGSLVYDIGFDESGGLSINSDELSLDSLHLFEGYQITDWAYQKTPHSILWAVRSDGVLLGLTYVRDQKIFAWHRHYFNGTGPNTFGAIPDLVQNVCVVPENNEHVVYLTVQRYVHGEYRRYIERMYTRKNFINQPMLAFGQSSLGSAFMDSCLSFDGRNTDPLNQAISITGGTNWDENETLTLTTAGFFLASDVGKQIHVVMHDSSVLRFTVTAYTSSNVVSAKPNRTVPVADRINSTWQFGRAVKDLSGLNHLEGLKVSVLADGFVQANPNNPRYSQLTVTDGKITIPNAAVVIFVGLPKIDDIETLDIDSAQSETVVAKQKLINEVNLWLENSRGGFVGTSPPENDATDALQNLTELVPDNAEDYESPPALVTDTRKQEVAGNWNNNGRVFIRQIDPLPITINAIAPSGAIPFGNGA